MRSAPWSLLGPPPIPEAVFACNECSSEHLYELVELSTSHEHVQDFLQGQAMVSASVATLICPAESPQAAVSACEDVANWVVQS